MSEEKLILREYTVADSEAVRLMLNEVFSSHLRNSEAWLKSTKENFTAAVAEIDGKIIGAIPLKRFDFVVAPGRIISAWAEFRVGVSAKYRGMGIGNKLQDCLKGLLKGRADIITIRSAVENSGAYQFYRKNGFHDISMSLSFSPERNRSTLSSKDIEEISEQEFLARDSEWNVIFDHCYGGVGGYISRQGKHRPETLNMLGLHSKSKYFMLLKQVGKITGYGVIFALPWGNVVLECAFLENFQEGFNKILNMALDKFGKLRIYTNSQSQAYECLVKNGYAHIPASRNPVTAFVVDAKSLAYKAMKPSRELEKLNIKIWTTEREEIIFEGAEANKSVTLEMKEYSLVRLLTRRMNLQHAVELEEVTCINANKSDIALISQAFEPVPWDYFELDGI